MLTCAPWVRSLCIPFPSARDALPKEGGKIARDKRENEEQQTFDSHVGINLISVRSSSDQKCTYLQRALILSRVKLKRGGLNPCSAKFTIKILKSGDGSPHSRRRRPGRSHESPRIRRAAACRRLEILARVRNPAAKATRVNTAAPRRSMKASLAIVKTPRFKARVAYWFL